MSTLLRGDWLAVSFPGAQSRAFRIWSVTGCIFLEAAEPSGYAYYGHGLIAVKSIKGDAMFRMTNLIICTHRSLPNNVDAALASPVIVHSRGEAKSTLALVSYDGAAAALSCESVP